ncbi:MAG: 2-succinyl-5-enolpyruvyl-6-hydroxy-3-cyclohexene-1-carboxylic-acid synthase, partial [Acidimicrobiales bacterium]
MTLPGKPFGSGTSVAAAFCATLVDEWVRHGLTAAVICPGSRSTPMALALAAEESIAVEVRLDERSAAFFALGIAHSSGRPAVLLTTSGTAAAECYPAVIEAAYGRVPMIVCTADRPPELQHVGAPQAIDQSSLYGRHVRFYCDPGVPDQGSATSWRSLGSRVALEATAGPYGPGPVHLNLPFREPLVGEPGELPEGRAGGRPWHAAPAVTARAAPGGRELAERLSRDIRPGRKGLIVAGGGLPPGAGDLVAELAGLLEWPVLADPRARIEPGRPGGTSVTVVGAADALVRSEGFAEQFLPEVVLRVGAPHASKELASFLARSAAGWATQVGIDPYWAWRDPSRDVAEVVCADEVSVLSDLFS